jgi:two-component system, OmpR family, phosphate regulon sensor histidine kinase PhoR
VRYANERALVAFPIRTGEALTFRLRAPDLVAAFDRVAKGGAPERVEFAERVPTERWFGAWFARLDGSDGRSPFIALILDDLSEQRRTDRIRVDFVANASHELRTPLASLVGFIETLQGPAREDAVARERFLKIMHDQAARMSRLVNDLLSLSRIEMKAHVRPSTEADLSAIIRHLDDALEPLARDLGVAVETALPDAPVVVSGDRDELIQVFENLIENACKYGQSGKKVLVTVAPGRDGVGPSVSVRDFGPGIAEEHLPRLTERFYRVDVEASRQHRGTGLGLAIVKHILARHQARLSIESRLGEGANFIVMFPQGSSPRMAESSYLPMA